MSGKGDDQINGAVGTRVTEVVQCSGGHGVAAGPAEASRTPPSRILATAALEARLGEGFDAGDPLSDIGNILTWSKHGCSPDERRVKSSFYAHKANCQLH
jgi:hypothetical protein